MASYHFYPEADGGSYISYASAPEFWKLDNGEMPPEKKPWMDVSYDMETRTFRGKINWAPNSFEGKSMMEFRLVFDEGFTMVMEESALTAYDDKGAFMEY